MDKKIYISIKPKSVNECWKGQRYKTPEYSQYCNDCGFLLPNNVKMPLPPFRVYYEFGMSNTASDIDNPVKPITDILQKKYKFNDKDIYELHIKKIIVPKGREYIGIKIENIADDGNPF